MGGCLLPSGNDIIRLFPCKMQFCLDMHVWRDESYANHVSRDTVIPCKQLSAANSLKSKHCIRFCPAFCLRWLFPAEDAVHQVELVHF